MAIIDLIDTQSRAKFFRHTVLTNLRYWQDWLPAKTTDVTALDRERNGIIRAISFALELEAAWPRVYELALTFSPFMERRGHWDTWKRVLDRAIEVARQRNDEKGVVDLLAILARLFSWQSRYKEAIAYYRRVILSSRQIRDRFGEARACTNLGYIYVERGYWYRAEVLCCHALNIFEQINNEHGQAHTENHLGILYTRQGLWDIARQHLERACDIWQSMGDNYGLMNGYNNLGRLFNETGRFDEAMACLENAVYQAQQAGEESLIGTIYMNMGNTFRLKDEPIQAEKYYWQAKTIFQQFSNSLGLAQVQDNLGLVKLDQKKWQEAGLHLKKALETWRKLGNKFNEIQALIYLVEYELARGNSQQANHWLKEAEHILGQYHQTGQYHHLHMQVNEIRRSLTGHTTGQATAD